MTTEIDIPTRLGELIDQIAAGYAEGERASQAAVAREEFLQQTGRTHEDDPSFDARMTVFIEWFLLDRPLDGHQGATPCEIHAREVLGRASAEERRDLLALLASHRSLFAFSRVDGHRRLLLDDLLRGMRWAVFDSAETTVLTPGDVVDARLVGIDGLVHFSTGFCYHPSEMSARIRRWTGRLRQQGEAGPHLLGELMTLRLHYDRAEGVPAADVYHLDAR